MLFEDMTLGPYEKGEYKARRAFELYEDGKIPQALSEIQDAIDINPTNSFWHFNKALALDAMGK